jgi:hypothetical protein
MSSSGSTRGNPAMADIVRSMVAIVLIILVVYGIGKFFTSDSGDPVEPVDYAQAVAQARPVADFPVLAPKSLPKGWRANAARFEPGSWHLGVLTDDDKYIGLEQVRLTSKRAIETFAEGSKRTGSVEIDGATWSLRKGPDGRTTLLHTESGRTTLVNATAPQSVVEDYVSSLSAS